MKLGSIGNKNGETHGMRYTPTYFSWDAMLARCTRASHNAYHRYGGAGVTVCDRWLTFENFFVDMGIRPDDMTLERRDNSKGYSKENCRWATRREQQANRNCTPNLVYCGITKTLSKWAEFFGVKRDTLYKRFKRGWSPERILQP